MNNASCRRAWSALALCCLALVGCGKRDDGSGYTVALLDLEGRPQVLGHLPTTVFAPRISPDGKTVAFEMDQGPVTGRREPIRIWLASLDDLQERRALPPVGTGRNWAPMWTRDGEALIFLVSSDAEGSDDTLYWRHADGTGEPERLIEGLSAESTTPDGRQVSFITLAADRDYDISLLDLGTRETTLVTNRPRSEQHSSDISPDGRWIAYSSNETGVHEVWAEPLPATGERIRVTHEGASHPVWARDGRSLFFDRGGTLFRVPFDVVVKAVGEGEPNREVKVGEPRALPISGFQQGYRRRQFDLMPDGAHFLMLFVGTPPSPRT